MSNIQSIKHSRYMFNNENDIEIIQNNAAKSIDKRIKCPKCGSENIRIDIITDVKTYRRGCFGWLIWILGAICTFGIILIIPLLTNSKVESKRNKVAICQNCGHVMSLNKEEFNLTLLIGILVIILLIYAFNRNDVFAPVSNDNKNMEKNLKIDSSSKIISETYSLKVGSNYVSIQGKEYPLNAFVIEINGNTYLPFHFFGDRLGAENLSYDPDNEVITFTLPRLSKSDSRIIKEEYSLLVGSTKVKIQGQEYLLNAPVIERNGTSYIPLRFITERLGAENLLYDPFTETITFTLPKVAKFKDIIYLLMLT